MIAKKWRDAATLMIAVKSHSNAYKVLMLKRSSKSKFMPNAYVFPGGVKSEADFSPHWNTVMPESKTNKLIHSNIFNIKSSAAVTREESTPYHQNVGIHPGVGYRICALRETFEESGLLMAKDDESGEEMVLSNPNQHVGGEFTTLSEWRKNVHNDASKFLELFRHLKLSPAVDKLMEWSTWLTPTFEQYRYNTMFYLSCIDDPSLLNDEQNHCDHEMTETKWISPGYALENLQDSMFPPQVVEMLRLNKYNSYDGLKDFASNREREGLSTWCPHLYKTKDGVLLVYPGDDLHKDDVNAESTDLHDRITIDELNSETGNLNRMERRTNGVRKLLQNVGWHGHEPLGLLDLKDYRMQSKL